MFRKKALQTTSQDLSKSISTALPLPAAISQEIAEYAVPNDQQELELLEQYYQSIARKKDETANSEPQSNAQPNKDSNSSDEMKVTVDEKNVTASNDGASPFYRALGLLGEKERKKENSPQESLQQLYSDLDDAKLVAEIKKDEEMWGWALVAAKNNYVRLLAEVLNSSISVTAATILLYWTIRKAPTDSFSECANFALERGANFNDFWYVKRLFYFSANFCYVAKLNFLLGICKSPLIYCDESNPLQVAIRMRHMKISNACANNNKRWMCIKLLIQHALAFPETNTPLKKANWLVNSKILVVDGIYPDYYIKLILNLSSDEASEEFKNPFRCYLKAKQRHNEFEKAWNTHLSSQANSASPIASVASSAANTPDEKNPIQDTLLSKITHLLNAYEQGLLVKQKSRWITKITPGSNEKAAIAVLRNQLKNIDALQLLETLEKFEEQPCYKKTKVDSTFRALVFWIQTQVRKQEWQNQSARFNLSHTAIQQVPTKTR